MITWQAFSCYIVINRTSSDSKRDPANARKTVQLNQLAMASKTKPHASENATAQEIQVGPIPPPADTSNQFNMEPITEDTTRKLSARKENITLVLITLTQLVQMIPLGVGINSGLAIGRALGANDIQSTWIVASYPLTQGTFVLIGEFSLDSRPFHVKPVSHADCWIDCYK